MTKLVKKYLLGNPIFQLPPVPGTTPETSDHTRIDYWLSPKGLVEARLLKALQEAKAKSDQLRRSTKNAEIRQYDPTKDGAARAPYVANVDPQRVLYGQEPLNILYTTNPQVKANSDAFVSLVGTTLLTPLTFVGTSMTPALLLKGAGKGIAAYAAVNNAGYAFGDHSQNTVELLGLQLINRGMDPETASVVSNLAILFGSYPTAKGAINMGKGTIQGTLQLANFMNEFAQYKAAHPQRFMYSTIVPGALDIPILADFLTQEKLPRLISKYSRGNLSGAGKAEELIYNFLNDELGFSNKEIQSLLGNYGTDKVRAVGEVLMNRGLQKAQLTRPAAKTAGSEVDAADLKYYKWMFPDFMPNDREVVTPFTTLNGIKFGGTQIEYTAPTSPGILIRDVNLPNGNAVETHLTPAGLYTGYSRNGIKLSEKNKAVAYHHIFENLDKESPYTPMIREYDADIPIDVIRQEGFDPFGPLTLRQKQQAILMNEGALRTMNTNTERLGFQLLPALTPKEKRDYSLAFSLIRPGSFISSSNNPGITLGQKLISHDNGLTVARPSRINLSRSSEPTMDYPGTQLMRNDLLDRTYNPNTLSDPGGYSLDSKFNVMSLGTSPKRPYVLDYGKESYTNDLMNDAKTGEAFRYPVLFKFGFKHGGKIDV